MPSKAIADLAITTPPPTPPTNLLPLHVRIPYLLRSTCNNSEIQVSGREAERSTISDFLASFIDAPPQVTTKLIRACLSLVLQERGKLPLLTQ
jgi:cell division control protein 6